MGIINQLKDDAGLTNLTNPSLFLSGPPIYFALSSFFLPPANANANANQRHHHRKLIANFRHIQRAHRLSSGFILSTITLTPD